MRKYPAIALFASVLLGQAPTEPNVDRTFYFTQATTPQGFQEAATAIRSITNIRLATADQEKKSLAVQAPADQVALAQWLYNELDQKAPSLGDDPSSREYRIPGSDEIVRIFYRTRERTPQELAESATLVRSISNMRQVFTYNERRAVVMRAPADQMALAEWLFADLDKHAPAPGNQHSSSPEYRASDNRDGENIVRVFYLGYAPTAQDFVEVTTLTRSIANLRQVFQYNSLKAVAMRGTAGQMALAEWLLNQIDRPAKEQVAASYQVPENKDDVVRVMYLTNTATPQEFVKFATRIRSEANVQKAFQYTLPRAFAVRGTSEQVALAEQVSRQQ